MFKFITFLFRFAGFFSVSLVEIIPELEYPTDIINAKVTMFGYLGSITL